MDAQSIEFALKPAFDEISRRSKATLALQSQENDVTYFSRVPDVDASVLLDIPDQSYILLSMGTDVLAPRPLDRRRPALRVYGAFPFKDHRLPIERKAEA